MSALSPTVVPLIHRSEFDTISAGLSPRSSAISFMPSSMARVGSAGVESALYRRTSPDRSARTRSVKVPPASMPSRYFVRIVGLRRRRGGRPPLPHHAIACLGHINCKGFGVGNDDAVVFARPGHRDQAVLHIQEDFFDRTLKGIAVSPTAWIEVGDSLARFEVLDDVLADCLDFAIAPHL